MEWRGVEWSGAVWTGVERSRVKWSGVEWSEWNSVEWHGMERHGVEPCGVERQGVQWNALLEGLNPHRRGGGGAGRKMWRQIHIKLHLLLPIDPLSSPSPQVPISLPSKQES